MKVIRQRTGSDCVVCALAMFLGRTYEEVARACFDALPEWWEQIPVSYTQMWAVTERFGVATMTGRYASWDHPAIITVPSHSPLLRHAVYWTGEKVLDPHPMGVSNRDNLMAGHWFDATQARSVLAEAFGSLRNSTLVGEDVL